MRTVLSNGLLLLALLALLEPIAPTGMVAVPAETGVYTEDFSTRIYLDYTSDAEWSIVDRELRLSPADSVSQRWPTLTPAPGGGVYLVWASGNDVYAQRFDNGGFPIWESEVRVNRSSGTSRDQWAPAATSDANGNLYVVWQDSRNYSTRSWDIYVQKLLPNGAYSWADDVRVNSDTGWNNQQSPDIAVDNGGNIIVVWTDYRDGNSDIYAQKLDGLGAPLWASEIRVNQDGGTASQYEGELAIDSAGYAIVSWADNRTGHDEIYAQRISPAGVTQWPGDVRVNADTTVCERSIGDIVPAGNAWVYVVWQDKRTGYDQVYAQLVNRYGQRQWNSDTRINHDTGDSMSWAVAASGAENGMVVVWSRYGSPGGLYVQKVDPAGSVLWSGDVQVCSSVMRDGSLAMPDGRSVAVSSERIFVAWEHRRTALWESADIFVQALESDGTRSWGEPRVGTPRTGGAAQEEPDVAKDPVDGSYAVVWTDNRDGEGFNVYAQRFDAAGNRLWPAEIRVNDVDTDAFPSSAAVGIDPSRNIVVAWSDGRTHVQKLDRSGNRLFVSDVVLAGGGAESPGLAIDSTGDILVSWTFCSQHADVYLHRLDNMGRLKWADAVQVNSVQGTASCEWRERRTNVAVDGAGNAVVVWTDIRNGDDGDIYAQKVDRSGNKVWAADVSVSQGSTGSAQTTPSASMRDDGSVYVAWEDDRGGYYHIYAQRLSSSGTRMWSNDVRVNDFSWKYRDEPNVSVDDVGNAFVGWQERSADGLPTVMMQYLSPTGSRLWPSDVQANLAGDAYRPTIAIVNGNALVVWEDWRYGNADVYGQLLSTTGSRLWSPDWRAISPDFFYFSPGLVQSRSVDATTNAIRQATLTANYQTNGGSVQFYLTNNGGAKWAAVTPGVTHIFTTTGSDLRWRAVLTGDPVWRHRSPVVSSLRVEYSTATPGGDDYEPDDTCTQARPIQVNGAAQRHNFHQYNDSDWVWFDGQADVAYIIQTTNIAPRADTVLELYNVCGALPIDQDDNAFGPGATLSFTAPATGRYYVRVLQHDSNIYGADTGYDLSVRAQRPSGAAIIVAGRMRLNDDVQPIIEATADWAYQALIQGGLAPDHIMYLSTATGKPAVDDTPTKSNIRNAIQDWARTRVGLGAPLWLYLANHGNVDRFHNNVNEVITAAELDLWLSNLEATSGVDQINVIIDACFSGSFIDTQIWNQAGWDEISGHGRVVVSSTTYRWWAYAPHWLPGQPVPLMYFSEGFWRALGQGQSVWDAFLAGRAVVEAGGQRCGDYAYTCQRPWLDDTGDAWFDASDGLIAQTRGLGASFSGSIAPYIDWLTVGEISGGQATVQAQVRDDSAVTRVWARVFAPSFRLPQSADGTIPTIDVPEVELARQSGDVFAVNYAFTEPGAYQVVLYAQDDEGHTAAPRWTLVGETKVYLPLVTR